MEMELISRETIKPSTPTPPNLTIYPLSLIDNMVAPNSVPLVYFYPNQSCEYDHNIDATQGQVPKILALKKSLSEVLSIYYPLAGRLKDKLSIECKDQGVSLLVTRIKRTLSAFIQNHKKASLNSLFPDELQWKDMGSSASLVAIQINGFACGGIAISVCMSHKVGDVSVLFNFLNDWALLNRKCSENKEELLGELMTNFPVFDTGASPFPQGDLPVLPEFVFVKQKTVTRRFVFQGLKIESLKAMVSSHKVENPTRVEVVIALIYKCAVSALANNTPWRVIVNLRKRMVPPLPEKSVGNLVLSFFASNGQCMEKREIELHDVVSRTREGLSEFCDKYVKNFGDLSFVYEFLNRATSTSVSPQKKKTWLFFASWCRFGMYKADFGWGKPIWVTTCGCPVRNTIILLDTRDGNGIEAVVNMEENDMARFECDVELLQYVCLS